MRRYDIVVRYVEEARRDADRIARILVAAPDGARVPLGELATIEEVTGPRQITREDNQRFVAIQCNVVDRDIGSLPRPGRPSPTR